MKKPIVTKQDRALSAEHLSVLASLANSKYWPTLKMLLMNRISRDKNSILTYPEYDPVRLAVKKSFYKGRISAAYLIIKQIEEAANELELLEEDKKRK